VLIALALEGAVTLNGSETCSVSPLASTSTVTLRVSVVVTAGPAASVHVTVTWLPEMPVPETSIDGVAERPLVGAVAVAVAVLAELALERAKGGDRAVVVESHRRRGSEAAAAPRRHVRNRESAAIVQSGEAHSLRCRR